MDFNGYHEILLALACFLFLHFLGHRYEPLLNWPILGMLPSLLLNVHNLHDWLFEHLNKNSGTLLFKGPWFTNMNMLVTGDPANIHHILSMNFSNFPKGSEFMEIFDILGDGLFSSDSDWWKFQRNIGHGFLNNKGFLKFLAKTTQEKIKNGLIPILEATSKEEHVVDLQDVLKRYTFDSMCVTICGIDPGCLSIDFPYIPFAEALDDAEEVLLYRHTLPGKLWKLQRWLGFGREKKLSKAWKTIDQAISQYISIKREELSKRPKKEGEKEEEGMDLLTSYMKEEELGDLSKSNKFLRDTILSYLIAGRDTTGAALTWFLWLVSKNPCVESKIIEELDANFPGKGEKFKFFDANKLGRLVYLHGALCEALRLFPPVPFEHKNPLSRDVLPSGHVINKKEKILISFHAMGRMEEIWGKDCLEFKPERWILESGEIKHVPSYKFPAFNAGPRTCLGKKVAFTQMKAVAVNFIYNYRVEVVKGHLICPNLSIIQYMKHGLMARVKNRWI